MMSIILEGALDQELDEELGYSKDNWANLSTYFKYPEAVRRLIYTTNTMEGFNRQLRKVTKSKTVFPSDDSLLKMLYLAMIDITKKWTGHRKDWGQSILSWKFSSKKIWAGYFYLYFNKSYILLNALIQNYHLILLEYAFS